MMIEKITKAVTATGLLFQISMSSLYAQDGGYEQTMEKLVARLDGLEDPAEYQDLAGRFERIAEAEQDQWLPYYYAAYCQVVGAFIKDGEKDVVRQHADKAQELIGRAEALSTDNPEILCMKSMILSARISLNPPINGPLYGPRSGALLERAQELDPENPRTYYLQGQSAFHTPPIFGGGKEKAGTLLKQALQKYKTFEPETSIHPRWGKNGAEKLLKQID